MTGQVLPEKVRKGDPKRDRGNRTGFSTGANSAAAAAAATLGLVHGRVPDFIDCVLPNTQRVRFTITDGWTDGLRARAVSIKDAGDDPDATNGAHLTAEVERLPGAARTAGLWIGRLKRSFNAIKQEVEREIGADEIRRQLHNEHILSLEQEARKILSPVQEPAKPVEPVAEHSIAPALDAPPAEPIHTAPTEPAPAPVTPPAPHDPTLPPRAP